MKHLAPLAFAGALMAAVPAQSAIFIDALQIGPDVVFAFEGDFDVTGLSNVGSSNDSELLVPTGGAMLFSGTGQLDGYVIPLFPSFGPGGGTFGTATGDVFKVYSNAFVGFAPGYDGETIAGELLLSAATFGSLGLTPGTYSVAASNGSEIILNIPSTVVPLPAALPLLAGALFGLGALRRRSRG